MSTAIDADAVRIHYKLVSFLFYFILQQHPIKPGRWKCGAAIIHKGPYNKHIKLTVQLLLSFASESALQMDCFLKSKPKIKHNPYLLTRAKPFYASEISLLLQYRLSGLKIVAA